MRVHAETVRGSEPDEAQHETELHFARLLEPNNVTAQNSLPTDWDSGVKTPAWVTETLNTPGHRIEARSAGRTFVNCTGLRIHYRHIIPEAAVSSTNALVVYVHGMGSHCNKYRDTLDGTAFAAKGVAWYALDHQAHGYSESHGHQVFLDVDDLVADVIALVKLAIDELQTADRRFTLYGESMGGAIVLLAALQLQHQDHPLYRNFAGCHLTGELNTTLLSSCIEHIVCLDAVCPVPHSADA